MPEAVHTVTIDRPRDTVFSFVADHENDARWRNGIVELDRLSGEGGTAKYRQVMKGPGGRAIDADFEHTEFEPGRLIAFRTTAGPVRPRGRYVFDDAGEGATRVTFSLEAELEGLKKLMAPMVGKTMRSEVQALDRLKRVLEERPAG